MPTETALTAGRSLQGWHETLGHVCVDTIKLMAKNGTVDGLVISSSENFFCGGCAMEKMAKKPYKSAAEKLFGVGERVHSDLVGPMEVASVGHAKYAIIFKDEASGYRRVYFMATKDKALEKLQEFVAEQRADRGQVMRTLRTDNGTEYVNAAFKKYLLANKINHETSAQHNPQQNGRIEREVRTMSEAARTMLQAKNFEEGLKYYGPRQ